MKTKLEFIGPKKANKMLQEQNLSNRKLRPGWVRYLARQMTRNLWMENTGESLKIDRTGNIIDGQHRLAALIKSGRSYHFEIDYEMDPEIFKIIDTGKSRGGADALQIMGVNNYALVSAIIASGCSNKMLGDEGGGRDSRPSNLEICDIYEKSPNYWQELAFLGSTTYQGMGVRMLSPSLIGAWAHRFNKINRSDCLLFWKDMSEGGSGPNSPTRQLIKVLHAESLNKNMKMRTKRKAALIIKAWNLFRENRTCRNLNWRADKQRFPKLK